MAHEPDVMEKVVSLAKRRGFVYPGSDIYGGLANSWDYGPLGVEVRNSIKRLWWQRYVHQRSDIVGIETALIMNPKVWEASGHTGEGFADPLVECKSCHERFRADQIDASAPCPSCGTKDSFTEPKMFNTLMKTFLGTVEGEKSVAYLRGETAQGMFVNFKNVVDSTRVTIPFGIAQVGKSFRNEITPGNFIFRTREFEQMEIEYFIAPPEDDDGWQVVFEAWRKDMYAWMELVGIDTARVTEFEVPNDERAHYSKRTIDFMFEFPFGSKELYGLAYRGDFDLKNHAEHSGVDLSYFDPETKERYVPHCVEPTWGVDRSLLAILTSAYTEDGERVVLKLKPPVAPYTVAVFPLLKNKPDLVAKARELYDALRGEFTVAWDDRGNIGKRYYSQDEIGTPWCVTVDFDALEDGTVTIRDRDSAKQERIALTDVASKVRDSLR